MYCSAPQASTKSKRYLGMFTSTKRNRHPGSLRGSPNHRRLSSKRFRESGKRSNNLSQRKSPRKPIRAKTIFNNIRQKSRNFGIRCKTSVSLWKQWIVNGIKWDKHNVLQLPRLKSKSSVNDIDNVSLSKFCVFSNKNFFLSWLTNNRNLICFIVCFCVNKTDFKVQTNQNRIGCLQL